MRFSTHADVTRDAAGQPRLLCPGAFIIPWWSSAMPRPAPRSPGPRVLTAFWWSAAIFASGAVICGTLLRRGPLTQAAVPQGAAAAATSAPTAAVRPGAHAGGQDGGRTAGEPPGVHF